MSHNRRYTSWTYLSFYEEKNMDDARFLEAIMGHCGFPHAIFWRLMKGMTDKSRKPGRYHVPGMFIAQFHPSDEVHSQEVCEDRPLEDVLEETIGAATAGERIAVVFGRDRVQGRNRILARNLQTGQELDIPLNQLYEHYEFFPHWCSLVREGADYRDAQKICTEMAVERFCAFFDQLQEDGKALAANSRGAGRDGKEKSVQDGLTSPFVMTDDYAHFLIRIICFLCADSLDLFCPERQGSHLFLNFLETIDDPNLMSTRIAELFTNIHVKKENRKPGIAPSIDAFPCIGERFPELPSGAGVVPPMFEGSRQALIKCAEVDWENVWIPDFAAMFQAHVPDKKYFRGECPSVTDEDATRILNPLFLKESREQIEEVRRGGKSKKLGRVLHSVSVTKIFDPDCGTGGLLAAAFCKLKSLEDSAWCVNELGDIPYFTVKLENFSGYARNEFAKGICQVALRKEWHRAYGVQENYMRVAYPPTTRETIAKIKCKPLGYLEDWPESDTGLGSYRSCICSVSFSLKEENMTEAERAKMREILSPIGGRRPSALNYAACGTMKAVQYVKRHPSVSFGFLCMDSSGRGDYNDILWPVRMDREMDVHCADVTFRDSKGNPSPGIGLLSFAVRKRNPGAGGGRADGENLSCSEGAIELGGGNLILTQEEYGQLSREERDLCKPYLSHDDILHGRTRYCLWIDESNRDEALGHDWIRRRLDQVRESREKSENAFVRKCAAVPWAFLLRQPFVSGPSLVVPARIPQPVRYVPVAYLEQESVVAHPDVIFPNPPLWLFALFSSAMYSAWIADDRNVQSACERCASFPIPALTAEQKAALEEKGRNILAVRKILDYVSLAEQYYSPRMRIPLLGVHLQNDLVVDGIYGGEGVTMSLEARRTLLRGMAEKVKGG